MPTSSSAQHHPARTTVRACQVSVLALAVAALLAPSVQAADVQFIITSDVHFGHIRTAAIADTNNIGTTTKDAVLINRMLVQSLNKMSDLTMPNDGGIGAGAKVGPVDFIAVTGDIATRFEATGQAAVQKSVVSYGQFTSEFLTKITLKDKSGNPAKFLLAPGNHDVSNAIGNTKIPAANVDGTSMMELLKVAQPGATLPSAYDRTFYNVKNAAGAWVNKPNYSMDVGGIHFISLTVWPDSGNRKWVDANLAGIALTTPVVLFMHDYPDVDSKHLADAGGSITSSREAVASDIVDSSEASGTVTDVEQRALVAWLKTHPNIIAYFHGHSNYNEMWDYSGPDHDITLKCFRIDSPMKGDISQTANNENLMSYQIASVDTTTRKMTVREIRWYPTPTFSTDTSTAANNHAPSKNSNVPKLDVLYSVAAPEFSIRAGFHSSPQAVGLSCATPNTVIYYTKDGSTPTTASTLYTVPIQVNTNTTIRAVAVPSTFTSQMPRESSAAYKISDGSNSCGAGSGLASLLGLSLGAWLVASRRRR